jgi:hypothetical protein
LEGATISKQEATAFLPAEPTLGSFGSDNPKPKYTSADQYPVPAGFALVGLGKCTIDNGKDPAAPPYGAPTPTLFTGTPSPRLWRASDSPQFFENTNRAECGRKCKEMYVCSGFSPGVGNNCLIWLTGDRDLDDLQTMTTFTPQPDQDWKCYKKERARVGKSFSTDPLPVRGIRFY